MINLNRRKIFSLFVFTFCLFLSVRANDTSSKAEVIEEVVDEIQEAYDRLPPKGKAIVGLTTGFVASRIVVRGSVTAVKTAGAAFVLGEVLHYSGVFDKIPEENKKMADKVKTSCLRTLKNVRKHARNRLAPFGVKKTIEKAVTTEKLATAGFAAGAFVGFTI